MLFFFFLVYSNFWPALYIAYEHTAAENVRPDRGRRDGGGKKNLTGWRARATRRSRNIDVKMYRVRGAAVSSPQRRYNVRTRNVRYGRAKAITLLFCFFFFLSADKTRKTS